MSDIKTTDQCHGKPIRGGYLLRQLRQGQGTENPEEPEIEAGQKTSLEKIKIQTPEAGAGEIQQSRTPRVLSNTEIFEQTPRGQEQTFRTQDDIEVCRKRHTELTEQRCAKDDIQFEAIKQDEPDRGVEEILGYKFLESIGLVSDASRTSARNETQRPMELQKEIVTHNGSCGANSIAISFYIQVLEGKISPLRADYTKLVTSWNTTYPLKRVTDATELFGLLKEEFSDGNTRDMEDILGPVIRVYIGICNTIGQGLNPKLSEDGNRKWTQENLEKIDLNKVREDVGSICQKDADISYDQPDTDIRSHKYYLDESELEVISSELFNCDKMRASEVRMDIQNYREVDRRLKVNEALIKKWNEELIAREGEEGSEQVEINSRVQAYPDQIEAWYRGRNVAVECYNVDMTSVGYTKWVEFQALVQIAYSNIEGKIDSFFETTNFEFMTTQEYKEMCEKIARRHIEEKLLIQLENGNSLIMPQWSYQSGEALRPSIYIAHSNFIYWDVLIPREMLLKYSREHHSKGREYALNPKHLEYLRTQIRGVLSGYYGDATPYINLQSEEQYDVFVRERKEHESESQSFFPVISELVRSVTDSLSIEKLLCCVAIFITACLMTSVLTGCVVALTLILGNAYFSEKNKTEVNQEKKSHYNHSSTWQGKNAGSSDHPFKKTNNEPFVFEKERETDNRHKKFKRV